MAIKRVQHVRHITTDADLFTGLIGEFTMDYTRNDLRVHDGVTPGGWRIMNKVAMDAAYLPRNDSAIIINDVKVHANPGNQSTRDFIVGASGFSNALKVAGLTGVVSIDNILTVNTAGSSFNTTGTTIALTIASTDAGASGSPILYLDRNSASPAASDALARVVFAGRNSINSNPFYASINAFILDPVSGTEDGQLEFSTYVAGTPAARVKIAAGLFTAGATGGDKGADTINATSLYEAGNLLTAVYARLAVANTFTVAGQIISSTTAGAAQETALTLLRNKGAGANADVIQAIAFAGESSTTVQRDFGRIAGRIDTATNAAELGSLLFQTIQAGAVANRLIIGNGIYTANATGADKGIDTINAKNFFVDGAALGRLINVQTFATAGTSTYTPTAGALQYVAEVVGAGGGGGGCATTAAAQVAIGGGGGGGGYARKRGLVSAISGATITVGAKGTGGTAGANAGTAGGSSSIGAVVSATGGGAGPAGTAGAVPNNPFATAGGTGSSGDINIAGGYAQGFVFTVSSLVVAVPGGYSQYGKGGKSDPTATGAAGNAAPAGYGGGGTGGINAASQGTGKAGGNGTDGLVIIWEYA